MILFKEEHVKPIVLGFYIDGIHHFKRATRRLGKKRWNVGAVHQCQTRMLDNSSVFTHVRILSVEQQALGSMRTEDAIAEGYADVPAFIKAWLRINGPNSWAPRLPVWVVTFEVAP